MNPCRSQWMVPSHDRQHGCTIQENLEILNEKIWHTETAISLRAACSFPNPYLLSLHLVSASTLAPSPISHCNSGRLSVLSWDSTPETRRSRMKRWRATEVEPTRILGIWVLVQKWPLFFAISWIYLRVIAALYLKVATLNRNSCPQWFSMEFNILKEHFAATAVSVAEWTRLNFLLCLIFLSMRSKSEFIYRSLFILPPTTCASVPGRFNTLPFYEWNSKIKRTKESRLFYKLNASQNQAKRFYTTITSELWCLIIGKKWSNRRKVFCFSACGVKIYQLICLQRFLLYKIVAKTCSKITT